MARLLINIMHETFVHWATTSCAPFPCGQDVWEYACKISRVPHTALPKHNTPQEVDELLTREGGLCRYAHKMLTSIGWVEVDDPERGDIAVLEVPRVGLVCSIFSGKCWMLRGDKEVLMLPLRTAAPLMIWRKI